MSPKWSIIKIIDQINWIRSFQNLLWSMGSKYFSFTGHAIPSSLQFFLSRQHAMQGYARTLLCKNITHMHKHTKKKSKSHQTNKQNNSPQDADVCREFMHSKDKRVRTAPIAGNGKWGPRWTDSLSLKFRRNSKTQIRRHCWDQREKT